MAAKETVTTIAEKFLAGDEHKETRETWIKKAEAVDKGVDGAQEALASYMEETVKPLMSEVGAEAVAAYESAVESLGKGVKVVSDVAGDVVDKPTEQSWGKWAGDNWQDLLLAGAGALGITAITNFVTGFVSDPEERSLGGKLLFGVIAPLAALAGGAYLLFKARPSAQIGNVMDHRSFTEERIGELKPSDLVSRVPEELQAQVRAALQGAALDKDGTFVDKGDANFNANETLIEGLSVPAGAQKFEIKDAVATR